MESAANKLTLNLQANYNIFSINKKIVMVLKLTPEERQFGDILKLEDMPFITTSIVMVLKLSPEERQFWRYLKENDLPFITTS